MTTVHVVVPEGIDDPRRPSGGNHYDRRVCSGLATLRWRVREHHVPGAWPNPDDVALTALSEILVTIADGSVVLVDGLVASAASLALVPAADRLRLVVLVHLPLSLPGEDAVLAVARRVVTTSAWSRTQLLRRYPLDSAEVHVAEPGTDATAPAPGTPAGAELLCVAAVSHHKGHDLLLSALAAIADLPWRCRIIGSLDRDPAFADRVRHQAVDAGIGRRITFCGARTGAELAHAYAGSDVLVHPSRGETYGMVVTEALARALPVLATDVGGVSEAMGDTAAGRPGLLLPPDAPSHLAAALRRWLTDEQLRDRLRAAAGERRRTLPRWETTTRRIAAVLAEAAA